MRKKMLYLFAAMVALSLAGVLGIFRYEETTETAVSAAEFTESVTVINYSDIINADNTACEVAFYDEEEIIDVQVFDYGTAAAKPDDPEKEGYTFKGWYYTDENGDIKEWDFDTLVLEDIVLYAKWSKNAPSGPSDPPKLKWEKILVLSVPFILLFIIILSVLLKEENKNKRKNENEKNDRNRNSETEK